MKSTILNQHRQKHGTWITEEHVTDDGTRYERVYFGAPKADAQKTLAANAASVEAEHAARLVQAAEHAATEQRRVEAVKRLAAQDVADVLGITVAEAEERKQQASEREVSRG